MKRVGVEKTLIYGCLHSPFHRVKAYEAMLDFIKYWKPDRIISNGDQNDLWNASKYFKFEGRKENLAYEIEVGREVYSQLRTAAGRSTEIIQSWGNHDARYDVYLQSQAPELVNVPAFQYEEVFGMNKYNIIPNRGHMGTYARYKLGNILVGHFPIARKHSADTEQALVQDSGSTIVSSHSHRKGVYYKTNWDNSVLQGMGTGCMCDVEQADYTETPNWQQGFVLATKITDKARYHLQDICVCGDEILFDGRLF